MDENWSTTHDEDEIMQYESETDDNEDVGETWLLIVDATCVISIYYFSCICKEPRMT